MSLTMGSGGDVRVEATRTITLQGSTPSGDFSSGIFASAEGEGEGSGDAGEIVIEAQQVRLSGGATIASGTFGPGKGGTVTVHAKEVSLEGATPDNRTPSGIVATAQGEGAGDAGTTLIEADHLTLSGAPDSTVRHLAQGVVEQ
jgi:hypothetical protein